jgi:uncharacterized membrane protein
VVFEVLKGFLHKYFVVPGYDWVDTTTYGIVLGILVLFAVIPMLKKLGVRLDKWFFIAVSPFIVLGATARELVDRSLGVYSLAGSYPQNFWLVSPWIFFTMFFVTLACLLLSLVAGRKLKLGYHVPMFAVGTILAGYNLVFILLNIENVVPFVYVLLIWLFFTALVYVSSKSRLFSFLGNEFNLLIVGAHLLDASATFVGVDFLGFGEQHVLPSTLINYFGTAFVMFPLKLVVLLPALYVIDKDLKGDETARRFIKFAVLVLGLGPAIRDVTMMLL